MSDQLSAAAPIHTYPFVVVTPDGGLAVSAGSLLVRAAGSAPPSGSAQRHSAACRGCLAWPGRLGLPPAVAGQPSRAVR